MSFNSKMTAINDKIRSLLGVTGIMGLDLMESNMGAAVSENEQQASLIQQIKAALETKTAVTFPALSNPGVASDLLEGKQLINGSGDVVTGTLKRGFAIKTGSTTSNTIDTGLSEIEQFFIYKESLNETGLIHLHYSKQATSRLYASAWSTNNYGSKTITNGTGGVNVNGGSLTITATTAATGGLSSGKTYKWIAIGSE